jgi:putative hydrolase of the HAD superfamily
MVTPTPAVRDIEAILFDMGGTLRKRVPDATWQHQSIERLLTMLGKPDAPASFMDELTRRYKSYTKWAQEHEIALSEAEIWTQWMTPELPRERIESQAIELMLVWRDRTGPAVLKPDAIKVIGELNRRGYRMGVVSNTTSTAELTSYLEECGLNKYFQVVVLSAVSGHCKPSPEIFWEATRAMRLDPARCAYVGNKIVNDVVGARKAGFALSIIIEPVAAPREAEKEQADKPDAVIHELSELLDIFPPRGNQPIRQQSRL